MRSIQFVIDVDDYHRHQIVLVEDQYATGAIASGIAVPAIEVEVGPDLETAASSAAPETL